MPERTLTQRQLNRALLARQLLLERSSLSLTQALERVAGLQTQYAPSAYVGLWSRLRDFQRRDLTAALEKRRVVQATLMRATIHIVSARDFRAFSAAIRRERRAWWLRAQKKLLQGVDLEAAAALVRAHLLDGPRRATELQDLLVADGYPRLAAVSAGMWIDMVRVPPSGTWEQRRADLYGLAETWFGADDTDEEAGLDLLLRRYLSAFGPASLNDVAGFTALPLTLLRAALARLRLRRFRDERDVELFDVPGAPLPDPDTPAPPRFIPTWDASLLAHARRAQILPERYRAKIFNTKMPQSVPTFLLDGAVAGTWRFDRGRVRVEPFGRVAAADRRALDEEAERLAAFHGDQPSEERPRKARRGPR